MTKPVPGTALEAAFTLTNRQPCDLQGCLYLILFFPVHSLQRGIDHAAPGE